MLILSYIAVQHLFDSLIGVVFMYCAWNNIWIGNIDINFVVFFVSAENQIKAGQLNVMQALVEVMLVHKADANVAENAAAALYNICLNGVWLLTMIFYLLH